MLLHSTPCLQNKKGQAARGLTAQEFYARALGVRKAAWKEFSKEPEAFGHILRFSWDSASAHKSALPDINLLPEQFIRPPARSPDAQRVVESPHHLIHKAFDKRLAADPRIDTVEKAVRLLERVAHDVVTPEYIQKLVNSLRGTYNNIVERGGNWAEKAYR